jgi:hypothetical protein
VGPNDFAINANVRRALARRWVRAERLEVGVTEGVVLLRGPLEVEAGGGADLAEPDARGRFLRRLRSDLLGLKGVTDVVMDVQRMEGEGERWLPSGS